MQTQMQINPFEQVKKSINPMGQGHELQINPSGQVLMLINPWGQA
jgi:hypothetical protein